MAVYIIRAELVELFGVVHVSVGHELEDVGEVHAGAEHVFKVRLEALILIAIRQHQQVKDSLKERRRVRNVTEDPRQRY